MASTTEDLKRRQEIQSSLRSIVETSDKWLGRLRGRQLQLRLASSFLTAILFLIVAVAIGFGIIQNSGINAMTDVGVYPLWVGSSVLAFLVSGVATYFLLKRKQEARLKEISSLIAQMKKKLEEEEKQDKSGNVGDEGIIDDAFSLADKILVLLPEIAPRRRNLDSLLFGVVAFIVAAGVGRNLAVAVLVGAMVWLYFRYETTKTYDREYLKVRRTEESLLISERRIS